MQKHSPPTDNVSVLILEAIRTPNAPIRKMICAFLARHGFSTSDVDDVLNEVYKRNANTDKSEPTGWLRATALNYIREEKRKADRFSLLAFDENIDDNACSQLLSERLEPDDVFIKDRPITDYLIGLEKEWGKLSKEQKIIIKKGVLENQSWKDVAEALEKAGYGKVNEANVRQKWHRTKTALRNKIIIATK